MAEDKKNALSLFSNYNEAKRKTREYLGPDVKLLISPRKDKKYRVHDPNGKAVDFGSFNPPMEDFTMHKDEKRRERYLKRARNIKGNWKNNPYSPNNLSMNILW